MLSKLIRGAVNCLRIFFIRIRCGRKVSIYPIQPMRVRSQLMIQKSVTGVTIGKNFKLETDAKVRVVEKGTLTVGDNCFINCGSYLTVMGNTKIGDGCLIGPNVMIFDHDHDYKCAGGIAAGQSVVGEIVIGNNVWIGANSVILKGTVIGDNSVIAAGSIVKGSVPENSMVYQKRDNVLKCIRRD